MDAPTDEQLLTEYFEAGGTGFQTLVRRYARELFHFVMRFANNAAAADDIVQETFLQVHVSADRFDPTRRFKPWLFTIAANKARDWLRGRSRRGEVPLDAAIGSEDEGTDSFAKILAADQPDEADRLQAEEQRQLVQKVVSQMSDSLRETLVLAYYHRLPYKEMAEVLEIPLGTVKSRLHAAVGQFDRRYRAAARELERDADRDPGEADAEAGAM